MDHLSVVVRCKVCGDSYYIEDCRAGTCIHCADVSDDFDADELGLDPEEEYDA